MKLKKAVLLAVTVLPLVVYSVALFFMPELIPVHYGADFTVDRYGSKYEIMIFPPIILVLGLLFLLCARFIKDNANKKSVLDFGIAFVLAFNALSYYLLYVQASGKTNLAKVAFPSVLLLVLGILFIFAGNLMPMSRRNSLIGLRTVWSRKNDYVWKKCQLFGGVSLMLFGLFCIIIAFVFPNIFLMAGVLLFVCAADVIYTYIAAKNDTHEKEV